MLTTDSLAIKPVTSAVAQRQSPKPSGANTGAMSRPSIASRLRALSETTFSCASKLCKNHTAMVAKKMTVNARCKKSFALSHSRSATLFALGRR